MKIAFLGEISPAEITQNMYTIAELFALYEPSARIHIFRKRQDRERDKKPCRLRQTAVRERNAYPSYGEEISFYDCGSRMDEAVRRQVGSADLVVVNMPQSSREWERFSEQGMLRKENAVFLIGNYFEGNPVNREMIEKNYRVDAGKIGIIPYNNEFSYAAAGGKLSEFFYRDVWQSEKNKMLREELERTMFLFSRELKREKE